MTVLHEEAGFRLRHLSTRDAERLLTVTTDPDVMRHVGDGSILTRPQVDLWIERSMRNYQVHGYGTFALADPDDDRLVGWAGFVPPGAEPVPEMIYGFETALWGRGLGGRVAGALVGLATGRFRFPLVLATIDDAHTRSCRIVERLGFRLDRVVVEDGVTVRRYLLGDA